MNSDQAFFISLIDGQKKKFWKAIRRTVWADYLTSLAIFVIVNYAFAWINDDSADRQISRAIDMSLGFYWAVGAILLRMRSYVDQYVSTHSVRVDFTRKSDECEKEKGQRSLP